MMAGNETEQIGTSSFHSSLNDLRKELDGNLNNVRKELDQKIDSKLGVVVYFSILTVVFLIISGVFTYAFTQISNLSAKFDDAKNRLTILETLQKSKP